MLSKLPSLHLLRNALWLLVAAAAPGAMSVPNTTVDPCPDATWKDAVFLRDPKEPSYFENITVSSA